jgi:CHASE3 domain sensor protein
MIEASSGVEAEFRGGPRGGPPLPPGPLLGFVIAVAAVAFIALLTYRSLQTRSIASNRVTHTLQVMEQLQQVLSLAKDAETGQRGYLLTGEEAYLEPFTHAKAQLPDELRKASDLVENDPVQLLRVKIRPSRSKAMATRRAPWPSCAVIRGRSSWTGSVRSSPPWQLRSGRH